MNRIGLLIDSKVLNPELVFSICHTVIIRCWFKLEPYITFHEEMLGARYGRRIKKLAKRAQRFHDVRPFQRKKAIKLYDASGRQFIVYQTKQPRGIIGIITRIKWFLIYHLHLY